MIKFIISLLVLLAVLLIIPFFNWPDIPINVFYSLQLYVNYIWSFNAYIPVDTIFTLARWIIGIELSFVGLRMLGKVAHMISGRPNMLEEVGRITSTTIGDDGQPHTRTTVWSKTKNRSI